jgi:hypothetical protein
MSNRKLTETQVKALWLALSNAYGLPYRGGCFAYGFMLHENTTRSLVKRGYLELREVKYSTHSRRVWAPTDTAKALL